MTVHHLYGTYLMHLVEKIIREHAPLPVTVKDIARNLHESESERQQRNLEKRVRNSLRILLGAGVVEREVQEYACNILCYSYKLKEDNNGTKEG